MNPLSGSPSYQFPASRFTTNSAARQWFHLLSEVLEVGWELLRGNVKGATMETWDCKHSAETLHRILEARHGALVDVARIRVLSGNVGRGYYWK
jgi:hypothetical protein